MTFGKVYRILITEKVINIKISDVIKAKRKSLKLSVKDVVAKLSEQGIDISEKTIYGWESGHRQPDADTFLLLCDIYQIENITQEFGIKKSPATEEPSAEDDRERKRLLKNYDDLNEEGREKLLEQSEFLVSSGKYKRNIKNNLPNLGKEA